MILNLCTPCFIFVPSYAEIFQRVSELLSDHDFDTTIYIET